MKEYTWPRQEGGLKIRANGLGLDASLPVAFDNRAMVEFTRFMSGVFLAYKWTTFHCVYGLFIDGDTWNFVVADGNFTAFAVERLPPILEGPQLPDT